MTDVPAEPRFKGVYTQAEHVVISSWLARTRKFRLRKLSGAGIEQRSIAVALVSLDLEHEPKQYDRLDAAVAKILLRDIVHRLPRLRRWRDRSNRYVGHHRRLNFAPQRLFTITWPSQTPGLRGPVAYHRVWMPVFDRFVVTASEPTDAPHGYCDFALGSFADVPEWHALAGELIFGDWRTQFGYWWCKHRPEVSAAGIVPFEHADQLAERAWVAEHRVYYSKQSTPQAPRVKVARRELISNAGASATILAFSQAAESRTAISQEAT